MLCKDKRTNCHHLAIPLIPSEDSEMPEILWPAALNCTMFCTQSYNFSQLSAVSFLIICLLRNSLSGPGLLDSDFVQQLMKQVFGLLWIFWVINFYMDLERNVSRKT